MLRNSLLAALVMLGWSCSWLSTVVSFCVKENQERDVRRVVGPSSGSSWQIMVHIYLYTFLELLLTVNAVQVLGWWLLVHLKENSSYT